MSEKTFLEKLKGWFHPDAAALIHSLEVRIQDLEQRAASLEAALKTKVEAGVQEAQQRTGV